MKDANEILSYIRSHIPESRSIRCKTCDGIVLKEKAKPIYPYWCPKCNKSLHEVETLETHRKLSIDELSDFIDTLKACDVS